MRFIEEEDQLRLVDVSDLGEVIEEVREKLHQERREECRFVVDSRDLEQTHNALALGIGAQEQGGINLWFPKECVSTLIRKANKLAQDDTRRRRGKPTKSLQLGLSVDVGTAKTGTPAADNCSANTCKVLVLPVPVAPATRP